VCSERREDRPSSLKESAKATNFAELSYGEVRRIPILRTRVNRGLVSLVRAPFPSYPTIKSGLSLLERASSHKSVRLESVLT
jgi:hypothetical protein